MIFLILLKDKFIFLLQAMHYFALSIKNKRVLNKSVFLGECKFQKSLKLIKFWPGSKQGNTFSAKSEANPS